MNLYEWIRWRFGRGGFRKLSRLVHEGFAQLRSEDYAEARSTFLQVLDFRDQIASSVLLDWVLEALESTWLFRDEYDEQITFFSNYVRRYPGDATAFCARAAAFWYSGRLQEAVDDYNRALEHKPDLISAVSGRAQVLAEMGRHRQALEEIDRALLILEKNGAANSRLAERNRHIKAFLHRSRGVALAGLGDAQAAMGEFTTSITLSGENGWVFYSRAEVYEKIGDRTKAMADYRLGLEKRTPHLCIRQRERAEARLRELER